jgi:YD repeat-containing protein
MKRTRRFPKRLVRWMSLCICSALVVSCVTFAPLQITSSKNATPYLPVQGQSGTPNGKARKVAAQPPQPGPPNGILPNLDQMRAKTDETRRTGGTTLQAPPSIPSTRRRYRRGRNAAQMSAPRSNGSLADVYVHDPAKSSAASAVKLNHARAARWLPGAVSYPPQGGFNFAMARLAPGNRTGTGGEDLLSNNFNWNLALVGLKGRGVDLGLTLSYNSLVWTRSGNYIDYDLDDGSIAPGFRLGFPTVEGPYWNDQAGTSFYLLVTPAGARVELRFTGVTNVYEAADSSHIQLIDYGSSLLLRPTDGTQLNFVTVNSSWRCNQIKDRNGNYLSISYNAGADIANITDTLGRVLTFNYDGYANLLSITQAGRTQPWATFGWGSAYVGYNFPGLTSYGPDGSYVPVLTQVGLADGSRYNFEYDGSYGMVSTIRHYAPDNHQRRYTTYVTPASSTDCPRLTHRKDWAENWNGINGVPSEVVTYFAHDGDGACRMNAPDGTVYKEYYGASWQSGLTTQSEVWSGGVRQKWTTVAWTQDNPSVSYLTNPRVTETNIYDAQGNRRRQTIEYGGYAQWSLPYLVREYAADGVTQIRHTFTDYNLSQAYVDRRIIGLVSNVHISNTAWWQARISYNYDEAGQLHSTPATTVQHDPAFNTSFGARGNVTSVSRWDTTDGNTIGNDALALTSRVGYDTNGSPVWSKDPLEHQSSISYADFFSDGNNSRNTFAYPTTATDADGFSSSVQYNFDFGAVTRTQGPPPTGQSQGAIQTMSYDDAGRIQWINNLNNSAWRFVAYSSRGDAVMSQVTINAETVSYWTITAVDGANRTILTGGDHPGSVGGYAGVYTQYDAMGRVSKQSNPAETNAGWTPVGDDAAGWIFTQQTYDWKGRPLVTTNQDGTQKYASYGGCGCAGGEVVTLTDEVGRQQKVYSDVLGHTWKTEVLNWNGTVYATTTNTFNTRDQVTLVRQWAGAENGGGAYQDTTMSYDGYGRLQTKHLPQQDTGTATVYAYNADDTINSVTDARGASATYSYNNRHLVTGITYSAPSGITPTSNVSYGYDAAGNRTSMTDGSGSTAYAYDQLSRMTSETRTITGAGSYALSYGYNLGNELTSITDPFGTQVSYAYDSTGRTISLTSSGGGTPLLTMSNLNYRAWGAVKDVDYGNGTHAHTNYNQRLLPSNFSVSNLQKTQPYIPYHTASWTFDYHADGRGHHSYDSDNNFWDRSYAFDHAGRLTEGDTNRRARGQAPDFWNPDPYQQSVSYDVWNNSNRTGSVYMTGVGTTAPYSNNRRQGWGYDADGRLLQDDDKTHTYDAAGRQTYVEGCCAGEGTPEFPIRPALEITQTYDGDGRSVRRIQIARQNVFDENNTLVEVQEDSQTHYLLTSSVLGGAVVNEIWHNWMGQWAKYEGYVYLNGEKVATQSEGAYRHHNPVTGSWLTTLSGRYFRRDEHDPSGGEVPVYPPPQPSYVVSKFGNPMYSDGGDPFDVNGGCTSYGMPISCSEAAHYLESGLGQVLRIDTDGPNPRGPQGDGGRTVYVNEIELQAQTAHVRSRVIGVDDWSEGERRYYGSTWRFVSLPAVVGPGGPQNTATIPLDLNKIPELLKNPTCNDFVTNLINKAAELNPNNPANSNNALDLFNAIKNGTGGYFVQPVVFDGKQYGGTIGGSIANGDAKVYISPAIWPVAVPTASMIRMSQQDYALAALHETIHHAGKFIYSDKQLAEAAFKVTGITTNYPTPGSRDYAAWSRYWDDILKDHCRPPRWSNSWNH